MKIVSWSGGKDSTATIILAHEMGIKIDLIVICLVWFDKARKIYAEYPEHIDWIFNYAIPLFESWGYTVKIVESERDYVYWFNHIIEESSVPERIGKKAGFVLGKGCCMNREKVRPITKYLKTLGKDIEEYIGIAFDEKSRLKDMHKKRGKISLLEQKKIKEKECFGICEKYGLLSPMYEISERVGCWFCPNQKIRGFAFLKQNHVNLWNELLVFANTDNKVSENFKYSMTFFDVSLKVDRYISLQEEMKKQYDFFDME